MVDRYDVPPGDLVFWAMRRGVFPQAGGRDGRGHGPAVRRKRMLVGTGVAVLVTVAVGVALG